MRINKKQILVESLLEDDPAILDLRVDSNDNNDDENKNTTDDESKDDLEENDEKTEYVIPRKKTKEELANPKLSWFEENVIKKNIKERQDLAKELGIDIIADEFRNAKKK